jgi:hypothetical protein
MQNAADGGASVQSGGRNDSYLAIASDLVSLIERVRERMILIELAIAGESLPGDQEPAADVVVLDDVTPRYAEVLAALATSCAGLRRALHFLMDTDGADDNARRLPDSGRRA